MEAPQPMMTDFLNTCGGFLLSHRKASSGLRENVDVFYYILPEVLGGASDVVIEPHRTANIQANPYLTLLTSTVHN